MKKIIAIPLLLAAFLAFAADTEEELNVQISGVLDNYCKGDSVNLHATGAKYFVWKDENGRVVSTTDSLRVKSSETTKYSCTGANEPFGY